MILRCCDGEIILVDPVELSRLLNLPLDFLDLPFDFFKSPPPHFSPFAVATHSTRLDN